MFSFKRKKQLHPSQRTTHRIVNSKRWVHRNQLKLGMYVSALDKPWSETRFMFQGFVLDSQTLLEDVQNASEYVQVDAEKWIEIASNNNTRLCNATK